MSVGIVWYRAEDYDRLMAMFPDRDDLPGTFADWQVEVRKLCDTLLLDGIGIVKAYIDPVECPKWCAAHGMKMGEDARSQFAVECAIEADKKRGDPGTGKDIARKT